MQSEIFRKTALERLSSPEALDTIMHVTGPKSWLALVALLLVVAVTMIWGYTGSIATKAAGEGVIVRTGTVLNVVTAGAGMVSSIGANVGQRIKAGQTIARISAPEMLEKIRMARAAADEARAERQRNLQPRRQGARLQVEALQRDRTNAEREIEELGQQARIAGEQIGVDEQLLSKGLITRQQTLQDEQKVVAINGQIESLRAKIKRIEADQYTAQTDPDRFDEPAKARIADLDRTLHGLEREMEMSSAVVSPYNGEVIEMRAVPGAVVAAGSPILSIQPEGNALEVLVYLSSIKAKTVQPGMDAEISPSTVKREEFGFIRGKVEYVSAFPASFEALMRNFQNETLARSIMAGGPVNELRVTMEPDPGTASGFRWSSSRGPAISISSGTLCTAEIVTREQQPIRLALPFVRGKLGFN